MKENLIGIYIGIFSIFSIYHLKDPTSTGLLDFLFSSMSISFSEAPLCSFVAVLVVLLSIFLGPSESNSFDLVKIMHGQIWRMFTSHVVFENLIDTLVGLSIIYFCGQLEKQMGFRKFGAFVLVAFVLSVLLQLAVTTVALSLDIASFSPSSGPYFLVFSLLALFYSHIPKIQCSSFGIFGIGFSEKSWIYILGCQLMLAGGFRSICASLIGCLIGVVYDIKGLGLQKIRLPQSFEYVRNYFSPVGASNRPINSNLSQTQHRNNERVHAENFDYSRSSVRSSYQDSFNEFPMNDFAIPQPSEEHIMTLMNLGFDRDSVVRALRQSFNDVDAAANVLLR